MNRKPYTPSAGRMIILFLVVINTVIIKTGFTEDPAWYRVLFVSIPLLVIITIDTFKRQTS